MSARDVIAGAGRKTGLLVNDKYKEVTVAVGEDNADAILSALDAAGLSIERSDKVLQLLQERDRLKAALEKISNAQRRTDRLVPIERSDGLVDWLEVHAFARKALGDAS